MTDANNLEDELARVRSDFAMLLSIHNDNLKTKVRVLDHSTATELEYWPAKVALAEVAKEEIKAREYWSKEIDKLREELESARRVVYAATRQTDVAPQYACRALTDALREHASRFGGRE